jgi:hypothetical protein
MANMSYCRFENTFKDLRDCFDALMGDDELSEDEQRYKKYLVALCTTISEYYDEEKC